MMKRPRSASQKTAGTRLGKCFWIFPLLLDIHIIQDSSPTVLNDTVCSVIWYSDIASLDGYGYCKIEGRIKDMIIRGGENIYPAEIEQFLHTHPKIQEAQVNNSNQIHLYLMLFPSTIYLPVAVW